MTKVKICGLTNQEDLQTLLKYDVDAIGVITGIPMSPRNVSPEVAKELVRKTKIFTKTVLVIAPESFEEIIEICNYVKPDAVQVHGEKVNLRQVRSSFNRLGIIKPLAACKFDLKNMKNLLEILDAVLIDSSTNKKLGGTGKTHDWEISRKTAETIKPMPLILAGGLHSGNVQEAIHKVKPYAVDVCTGTEVKPGIKDPEKIQQFISAVKKADFESATYLMHLQRKNN
jgi:phosphoribosylanthranilate isomerase